MLVFVISVKSPKVSRNWDRFSELYERCLRSVCSQTNQDFKVLVVANELPKTSFTHPNIEPVIVDFPPAEPNEKSREADKAKKLMVGFEHAQQYNPTHLMAIDADDCITNKVVEIVAAADPQEPGWLLRQGYLYKEGGSVAYLNTVNFNHSCGSTAIIRKDLYKYLFKEGPWYTFEEPKLPEGIELKPFPVPGAIYCILNGDNIFMDTARINKHKNKEGIFTYYWRKLKKYRPYFVSKRMREEFGLYKLAS